MDNILKSTFNNEAEKYDETTNYLLLNYDKILDAVVQNINYPKDQVFNILDVGCGTGNLIKKIRDSYQNANIYAIDFSKDMISVAKNKNIENIEYLVNDFFKLDSLELPVFDVIVSSYVFHNFHTVKEHKRIMKILNNHLSVNGNVIIADLINQTDSFKNKESKEHLVSLMRENNLDDEQIIKWLGILEIEDSPLTIEQNIEILEKTDFESVNSTIYENTAIFKAKKKLDPIQLKSELLLYGIKPNRIAKDIYKTQNPQDVLKTGNNGIFISLNSLNVLVSINHKTNRHSKYELEENGNTIILSKNKAKIDVTVKALKFPEWYFIKIPSLNNRPFSDFFVYEGEGYLHLAYKSCSFSSSEKCKFCSTRRRNKSSDNTAEEVCSAIDYVIDRIPNDVNICLGGGTYVPFEQNVEYFSKIIKCIRRKNKMIPIWVESIPPQKNEIQRLIDDGATSFGFNIEIWDDKIRSEICPGKSKISKDFYLEMCKYVDSKLGPNRIGSCLIVGLDSTERIIEAIDELSLQGIAPCILPYKQFNRAKTNTTHINKDYEYQFYSISKYAAKKAYENNIFFSKNQGCMKCSCCTLIHDFENKLMQNN